MPKLNLVLMIGLSVAVAAAASILALHQKAENPDREKIRGLLRLLGDHDPDVRRDAERELRAMGRRAEEALAEAAGGSDSVLAARARELLDRLRGAAGAEASAPPGAPGPEEESSRSNSVTCHLQVTSGTIRPGEPLRYYLWIRNGLDHPVLVARHRVFGAHRYGGFGTFELIDPDGTVRRLSPDLEPPSEQGAETEETVRVEPGAALEVHPTGGGILELPDLASRAYRIRFVYDAGEAYRRVIAHAAEGGSLLPQGRLVSNEAVVAVE